MTIDQIVQQLKNAGVERSADEVKAILAELDISESAVTPEIVQAIAEDLAKGSAIQKSSGSGKPAKQSRKSRTKQSAGGLGEAIKVASAATNEEVSTIQQTIDNHLTAFEQYHAAALVERVRDVPNRILDTVADLSRREAADTDSFREAVGSALVGAGFDLPSNEAA